MKLLSLFSILLFVVLSMVSCKKDDNKNEIFKATLNGNNEVPSNGSAATGSATLTFNKDTKIFSITVTHNLTGITAGHIHEGPVGVNGPAEFPFVELTSPINYTSLPLNSEQETDLYAGMYYVNLHTTTHAGGEIRGQLIKQ